MSNALLAAELRLRAAQLRVKALDAESLAYPLEGHSSQARRNRRKVRDFDLALQYDQLATQVEKEGLIA